MCVLFLIPLHYTEKWESQSLQCDNELNNKTIKALFMSSIKTKK